MRPQIDIAQYVPCPPGYFALELVYDDDKPSAHRNAIVAWALESGNLAPYPITLDGLFLENVAIQRPDGRVELPCNGYDYDLQAWLEKAHAEHLAEHARQPGIKAASDYISGQSRISQRQPLPASAPSPARQAIDAALDDARKATAERLAAPQSAHTGKVSP